MGDPIVITHEGREVRFCCAGCVPKFKAEPAKYLAMLDAAKSTSESFGKSAAPSSLSRTSGGSAMAAPP